MPLAMVSRSDRVRDDLLEKVIAGLPAIIARNLNVPDNPEAFLSPNDIEVQFRRSHFDVMHHDIQVIVFATKFEARVQTGQSRSDKIAAELQRVLPDGMTGFVWIVLADAFFTAFVSHNGKTSGDGI